jgi:hypothetical protein
MTGKRDVGENQLVLEPLIRRARAGACYGALQYPRTFSTDLNILSCKTLEEAALLGL